MAIQNEMPNGGTGWHGDQSVSLRSTLGTVTTTVNTLLTNYQAALAVLDGDLGTSYVGDPVIDVAASVVTAVDGLAHVALGGSYAHGDNAVALRGQMQGIVGLGNDLKAAVNALLVDLDTSPAPVSDGDYVATLAVSAAGAGAISPHFANGGSSAHGDQGVAVRTALQAGVTLQAELVTNFNDLMDKLDTDIGVTTYAPLKVV